MAAVLKKKLELMGAKGNSKKEAREAEGRGTHERTLQKQQFFIGGERPSPRLEDTGNSGPSFYSRRISTLS